MRVLVLYAHPVETSYCAALHRQVLAALAAAGHEVDDCDLYAEGFDPVMSRAERLAYHDVQANRVPVASHVGRLQRAEALVIVCPVWNYGFPAILKGYFDRVFLPGVSFEMVDRRARGALHTIRTVVTVTTYGGSRFKALLIGDPPRRLVTRMIRGTVRPFAAVRYLAHYDMNGSTPSSRSRFLARVDAILRAL
jgi:NAD(P)H dehydrogenase (quinone)